MRILAIDFGEKRIGIAISDPLKIIAQPLTFVKRKSIEEDINKIKNIINEYAVEEVLFGLPLRTNGEEGIEVEKVKEFAKILNKNVNIKINFWDERWTTKQAEEVLTLFDTSRKKKKKNIDRISAAIILQSYLDNKSS